jgi:hypothetical protein
VTIREQVEREMETDRRALRDTCELERMISLPDPRTATPQKSLVWGPAEWAAYAAWRKLNQDRGKG